MNSWLSPQSDSNKHPPLPFDLRARFLVPGGLLLRRHVAGFVSAVDIRFSGEGLPLKIRGSAPTLREPHTRVYRRL